MTQNRFVFIESNTTGTGELLINEAHSFGYQPLFLTRNPNKYSFFKKLNIEPITIDTLDRNALLSYLSNTSSICGIYSSSEYFIETAAWLAKQLHLPSTNPETIKLCRDKYALSQKLLDFEVHCPRTTLLDTTTDIASILARHAFPVIIKPNELSGSVGVKFCENKTTSLAHIDLLTQQNIHSILLQEYIEGPEFSVETCTHSNQHQIIGVTQKHLSPLPYCIETGHNFPAQLSKEEESLIRDKIPKLLTYLGFDFGFAHIELKIKNGQLFIIEVNPRLAGGMIPVLIQESTGINLLKSLIQLYAGQVCSNPPSNPFSIRQNHTIKLRRPGFRCEGSPGKKCR
ncbi:MAG: ATP-grasp domain-containing protein [Gammaproteobacteria bacterium]|nr:ATP-grasp domain-containing protein [Gammaproteobacteria bacterium]